MFSINTDILSLGDSEQTEVWLLPYNDAAYSPRILHVFSTVDEAREYSREASKKYAGAIELLRVSTKRQLVY